MAPPPFDPSNQRQKRGAPIKFLIPLIYAPVLPLIRLTLRHKPVLRDRLFTAVLAGAFAHGFYLVDMYQNYQVLEGKPWTCSVGAVPHSHCYMMIRTDIYDAESK